jgi:hypothetical protein
LGSFFFLWENFPGSRSKSVTNDSMCSYLHYAWLLWNASDECVCVCMCVSLYGMMGYVLYSSYHPVFSTQLARPTFIGSELLMLLLIHLLFSYSSRRGAGIKSKNNLAFIITVIIIICQHFWQKVKKLKLLSVSHITRFPFYHPILTICYCGWIRNM